MRMQLIFPLAFTGVILGACAPEGDGKTCDKLLHQRYVGKNIDEVTLDPGLKYHVLDVGDTTTMDKIIAREYVEANTKFRPPPQPYTVYATDENGKFPGRVGLFLYVDDAGRIKKIDCG